MAGITQKELKKPYFHFPIYIISICITKCAILVWKKCYPLSFKTDLFIIFTQTIYLYISYILSPLKMSTYLGNRKLFLWYGIRFFINLLEVFQMFLWLVYVLLSLAVCGHLGICWYFLLLSIFFFLLFRRTVSNRATS